MIKLSVKYINYINFVLTNKQIKVIYGSNNMFHKTKTHVKAT